MSQKEERVDLQIWRERRKNDSAARRRRNRAKYDRNDYRKEKQRG